MFSSVFLIVRYMNVCLNTLYNHVSVSLRYYLRTSFIFFMCLTHLLNFSVYWKWIISEKKSKQTSCLRCYYYIICVYIYILLKIIIQPKNTRRFKYVFQMSFAHWGCLKDAIRSLLSLIHISEPTRRTPISYAVFCLKKKNKKT